MTPQTFLNDISTETARAAYHGVSMRPEQRAESTRNDYAETLAEDYAEFAEQAAKGKTEHLLQAEFDRYRAGYRKRYYGFLHSNSRCVSWWIAGPSNFPAARMNKRADIAHKRLNELIDFRARAKAAIKRTLRPDLAPIYASDSNALERLEAKISHAEALQKRMKQSNETIRRHKKEGKEAQIAALMVLGYSAGMAQKLLEPDFVGRIGFADYQLTNNGANIRRMKQRVEHVTRLHATPGSEKEGTNARLEDCPAENRIRLWFAGKPSEEVRTDLKSNGFRWTPTVGCWQAYRNVGAYQTAKRIAGIEQNC